mgnify:CR=1 FL=1
MDSERKKVPDKNASDATIIRRLKRAGKSAPQIASYLRGWHQLNKE